MDRESYGVTMLSRRWSIRGKSSAEHLASLSALDSSGAGSVIAPVAKAYKQGRNYPLLCTPQLSECPYNIRVYIYIYRLEDPPSDSYPANCRLKKVP